MYIYSICITLLLLSLFLLTFYITYIHIYIHNITLHYITYIYIIYKYVSSLHIFLVSGVRYHQLVFTNWGTTLRVMFVLFCFPSDLCFGLPYFC